jgi:hypothetical protein
MLRIVFLFFVTLSAVSCGKVSVEQGNYEKMVSDLWNSTHQSEEDVIEVNSKPFSIRLKNRADALLFEVSFPNRGIHSLNGTLLYIPNTNELCDLSDQEINPIRVHDFDKNGVSEIQSESSSLGQGYMVTINKIYQLDDCNPIILKKVESTDNAGAVDEEGPEYLSINYSWEFHDIDGDQIDDLIEIETVNDGVKNIKPNSKVKKFSFYFKNEKYVKQ